MDICAEEHVSTRIIDTDILIDHFRGHQAALDYIADGLMSVEMMAVSSVTLTELLAGMRPGEEERTGNLLVLFVTLPIDEQIGRKAAVYLRQFRRNHRLELVTR